MHWLVGVFVEQPFNDESWKPIHFGGQKVKGQGHNGCVGLLTERNIDAGCVCKPRWVFSGMDFCTLVSAGFFYC